jgi:hypothetical protein
VRMKHERRYWKIDVVQGVTKTSDEGNVHGGSVAFIGFLDRLAR